MPSLARSVPKPLKVPSLARSVPKPLKVPSLARSVSKPLKVPTVKTVTSRQQKNIDSGPSVRHFLSNRGHFFFRQPDFLYIRKREKMGIFGNFYYGPFW